MGASRFRLSHVAWLSTCGIACAVLLGGLSILLDSSVNTNGRGSGPSRDPKLYGLAGESSDSHDELADSESITTYSSGDAFDASREFTLARDEFYAHVLSLLVAGAYDEALDHLIESALGKPASLSEKARAMLAVGILPMLRGHIPAAEGRIFATIRNIVVEESNDPEVRQMALAAIAGLPINHRNVKPIGRTATGDPKWFLMLNSNANNLQVRDEDYLLRPASGELGAGKMSGDLLPLAMSDEALLEWIASSNFEDTTSEPVNRMKVVLIGALGLPQSAELLLDAMRPESNPFVRWDASLALRHYARHHDETAAAALAAHCEDPDPRIREVSISVFPMLWRDYTEDASDAFRRAIDIRPPVTPDPPTYRGGMTGILTTGFETLGRYHTRARDPIVKQRAATDLRSLIASLHSWEGTPPLAALTAILRRTVKDTELMKEIRLLIESFPASSERDRALGKFAKW